ncbi:adenine phosphoribosyltransferase [Novimethylophilus kurashikiensis]|uniref:Adenine phosphoribosyltransferase n=1 Tax=Novimethylophilus kurashikiensis TaxID=1825523 RepID=A0A2R5F6Q8_9PROT|nr:adenine phosphoribosyltransferase [Novimethylophilus kurashikiensis]GBG13539.1 adenine phosphoribosyltransferase [Novimethylophilus kurashikiensis]
MPIKSRIRTIPHFPKYGIQYRDITTLLKDPLGLRLVVYELFKRYTGQKIDKIAAIESRGFIIAAPLAVQLGVGLVPIRKPGKLPGEKVGHDYQLEYGSDRLELHSDAIESGEKVLLVDDLLATGGTALAGIHLIEKLGGALVECAFVVDLPDVGGRRRLEGEGYSVFALCEFEGD